MQVGGLCEKARDGGLAGARRTPEDQGAERARLEHPRQRAIGSQQMILTDDIRELLRPQLICKRTRRSVLEACRFEQRLAAFDPPAHPLSTTEICWPPRSIVTRHRRFGFLI